MMELNYKERHRINKEIIKISLEEFVNCNFEYYKNELTQNIGDIYKKSGGTSPGIEFQYALQRSLAAIIERKNKQEILEYLHYAKDLGSLTLLTGKFDSDEDGLRAKFRDGEFEMEGLKDSGFVTNCDVRTWQKTLYLAVILKDFDLIYWLCECISNEELMFFDPNNSFYKSDYIVKDFLSEWYKTIRNESKFELDKRITNALKSSISKIDTIGESGNIALENNTIEAYDELFIDKSNYARLIKYNEIRLYIHITISQEHDTQFQDNLKDSLIMFKDYYNGHEYNKSIDLISDSWFALPYIAACCTAVREREFSDKNNPLIIETTSDYLPHWLIYGDFEDNNNWK
ncbi:hypothetical protein [Tenacibaculum sp. 190524A05c]|uniref:hypothetical protein n=1 Tax=Tenacibaculum platacis TaxID=3137852 RepID=UPI0032B1DF97